MRRRVALPVLASLLLAAPAARAGAQRDGTEPPAHPAEAPASDEPSPAPGEPAPVSGDPAPAPAPGDPSPASGDPAPASGDPARDPASGEPAPASGDPAPASGDPAPSPASGDPTPTPAPDPSSGEPVPSPSSGEPSPASGDRSASPSPRSGHAPPAEPWTELRVVGWATFLVSLGVGIGGGLLFAAGLDELSSVESARMGTPWVDLAGAAERAPLLTGFGLAALVLGSAGAALGAGLLAAGGERRSTWLSASLGPGGVELRGRF